MAPSQLCTLIEEGSTSLYHFSMKFEFEMFQPPVRLFRELNCNQHAHLRNQKQLEITKWNSKFKKRKNQLILYDFIYIFVYFRFSIELFDLNVIKILRPCISLKI